MIYIIKHKKYNNPIPEGYVELRIGELFEHKDKDNINQYNLYVNEVEGLYYMWKHCNDEIIGLNHYRRLFINNGEPLKMQDAEKILKDYDMIIAPDVVFTERNIYEQLKVELGDYEIYDKYVDKFCEKEPEFRNFLQRYNFNNSEMFVCRKELMNKYCEWLFPIILPIVEEFVKEDVNKVGNKRMIAHIIERFFSYWINKNNLKCYRMNYNFIPE